MEDFSKMHKYDNFETISVVNKGMYNTFLIQDPFSGTRYVKKELPKEKLPLYKKLQALKHQGLTEIIEVIEEESKIIVMLEYAVGETLKSILNDQIRLDEKIAISYIQQLTSILNVVHQNGMIHRDITPSNIIIETNGQVKLIDFDIARFYKNSQTEDTQLLGTPGYAAPEQFGFNQSNASSDIYALGILLNVMITGMKPNEMLIKDDKLATIVKNCTAMERSLRYQDVVQLDYDLRRLRSTIIEDDSKKIAKNKVMFSKPIVLSGVFLTFLGAVLIGYWLISPSATDLVQASDEPDADTSEIEQNASHYSDDDHLELASEGHAITSGFLHAIASESERSSETLSNDQQPPSELTSEGHAIASGILSEILSGHQQASPEITVIPSAVLIDSPSFDTFMPAPETIFTTLASENGLGDTFMVVEGRFDGWEPFDEQGITYFHLTNDTGTLFITGPNINDIYDPFLDQDFANSFPEEGSYLRVYFKYLGFSDTLDKGGGMLIGFADLDALPEAVNVSELVGEWKCNITNTWHYTFNADGTGLQYPDNAFTWSASQNIVTITAASDNIPLEWAWDISGNKLTLSSIILPGVEFSYIKQ